MGKRRVVADAPRVYSYIRFSRPEQLKGDSLKRQMDASQQWCASHGYTLDETLKLHDLGVSAFRGKNVVDGKLSAFIAAVEDGTVPQGSILLIESLDRLTRQELPRSVKLFLGILDLGISIVTLSPEERFDLENLDMQSLIIAIVCMSRAHEESETKSKRLANAWKSKRERLHDRKITVRRPNWLNVVDKGRVLTPDEITKGMFDRATVTFEPIPDAADAIRLLFELKLQGLGRDRIVREMNKTAPWKPDSGWYQSYVSKVLRNAAVIGEYQPHRKLPTGGRHPEGDPIPDYYPAIVDRDTFYAVQKQLQQNQKRPGRRDKVSNLFTHLVTCAYCEGRMRLYDKGKPPKGAQYLKCVNGVDGLRCAPHSVRYDAVEELVIDNCRHLRPEQVLPDPDAKAKERNALKRRIDSLSTKYQRLEEQQQNFINQIGETKNPELRNTYERRVEKLMEERTRIDAEMQTAEEELKTLERGPRSWSKWVASVDELKQQLQCADLDQRVRVRMRLQTHLREFIARIEVFAKGFERAYDPDVDDNANADSFGESMDDWTYDSDPNFSKSRKYHKFRRYVLSRRMSRDGRFIRVHFQTGRFVDLVPKGSVASGMRLVDGSWTFVQPSLDSLWKDFEKGRRVIGTKR